jgi:outer membrane murein-binding lipoprotein Lpp
VTTKIESMMGLLQNVKVGSGSGGQATMEVKPPETTVYRMNTNMASHIAYALDEILGGTPASQIPDCTSTDLNTPETGVATGAGACLPTQARDIVGRSGFQAAEELPPDAQSLYVSALSGQIAIADIRAQIIRLYSEVNQMTLKVQAAGATGSSSASATTTALLNKKKNLLSQIADLQNQVNAMQNYENAKTKVAQTEVAGVELNNSQIRSLAKMHTPTPTPQYTPLGAL